MIEFSKDSVKNSPVYFVHGYTLQSLMKILNLKRAFKVPEHKVDTDNTLWLRVLVVVDDSGLCFHPHKASSLGQHPVLSCADLALCKHCKQRETRRKIQN